jgi:hypothetical protein
LRSFLIAAILDSIVGGLDIIVILSSLGLVVLAGVSITPLTALRELH